MIELSISCNDCGDLAGKVSNMRSQMPSRLVIYLASHWREADPKTLEHWGEVAHAVLKTG